MTMAGPSGGAASRLISLRRDGSGAGTEQSLRDLPAPRKERNDMTGQPAGKPARRKPKARKFYILSYSFAHKRADFDVENLDVLRGDALALFPPKGRRGFPAYPEKPRVVIGKRKSGPPPSDIELFHSYWLVSDRLKSVFEAVDGQAFAFQECDVRRADGSAGPPYWLCDVVRVLEAFAEPTMREIEHYRERTGLQYRGFLTTRETLVFDEGAIGDHHTFRTPYSADDVFCDQVMKDACAQAGIKGIKFFKCFR